MNLSLKAQNRPTIIMVTAVYSVALWSLISPIPLFDNLSQDFNPQSGIFAGIAALFSYTVSELIPRRSKLFLVEWKWENQASGCQAFTKIALEDHRIDLKCLEKNYGPLPIDPSEQDRTFYKIYRIFQNEVSVLDAHKSYLLFRELCCLSFLLLFVGLIFGVIFGRSIIIVLAYLCASLVAYIIFAQAAQNAGRRLVANVLAVASADQAFKGSATTV